MMSQQLCVMLRTERVPNEATFVNEIHVHVNSSSFKRAILSLYSCMIVIVFL